MNAIERAKDVIEDLYLVGDVDLHPFLGQLNFFISQLSKSKSTHAKNLVLKEFPFLTHFMESSFRSLIENYIQRSIHLKTSRVNCNFTEFELDKAEKLLYLIPEILKITGLSKLAGDLIVDLDHQALKISALLKRQNGIKENKPQIIDKLKFLFKENIITTFKIRESEVQNCAQLELTFDLSYDNNTFYKIESGIEISLPNVIKNYEMSFKEFLDLGEHLIFQLNDNLEIKKIKRPKSQIGQVLHFHFLFRPISLIIPKKGILCSMDKEDTGSGKNPSFFIDIFSAVSS